MFEYRFWDDKNKKVLRHCDVTFSENVLYNDKEKIKSETTNQVGVDFEWQENSPSNVVADTHETPETTAEELDVEQGFKTTKQVGVEVELQKNSPSNVAYTQETHETIAKEPEVEQGSKTTKQVEVEVELQKKRYSRNS